MLSILFLHIKRCWSSSELYYLGMDNGMGPSLCFLLAHLVIQSPCHRTVKGGQPTCSAAHGAHIALKRKCPHSRCVSWGRWMLRGSSVVPISLAHPVPCLHFHSMFHISPHASCWQQSRKYLASNSALKCCLSLWKYPFKPASSNWPSCFSHSKWSIYLFSV